MKQKLAIGIDFGGTNIKTAVVKENGKIIGQPIVLATNNQRPGIEIIKTIKESVSQAIELSGTVLTAIAGIGIGSPGPLDMEKGVILKAPNLPTLHDFPLKETLEKYFKLPVAVNNDGNCFVLGEAFWGAAKSAKIVCGVTLGTGFGCGIVMDKKIFIGATGTAAEVWLSPYEQSNFEEYCAARSVTNIYQQLTDQRLTSLEIFKRAQSNENKAKEAWQRYGLHLGKVIAIIVNLLDPDVFVVGGSVSRAWEFFSNALIESLYKNINPLPSQHLKITKALLGDDAGLLGAAAQIFCR